MYRPKPYVYTPHILLTDYPGLFNTICHQTDYVTVDGTHRYCNACYEEDKELFPEHARGQNHLMANLTLGQLVCCRCRIDLVTRKPITHCTTCFADYLSVCQQLRILGYDPGNISNFVFNTFTRETMTLSLTVSPEDDQTEDVDIWLFD